VLRLTVLTQSELITFDSIRTCSQCAGAFSKARRVPTQTRPQNHRGEYTQRAFSPPPISNGSLSPPPTFSSQTSLLGPGVAIAPHELPLHMTPQSNFAPPPSEFSSLHEEPLGLEHRSPAIVERPSLSRTIRMQDTRPISSISSGNSSFQESTKTSQAANGIFGLRWGRSSKAPKKTSTKTRATALLPDSLQFCFSNCAKHLLVWRRNGDSIVRICAHDRQSRLLSLTNSIPNGEMDRSVNIKLVEEGEGWISVILLNKQVCK
jgi:hypothetical protein